MAAQVALRRQQAQEEMNRDAKLQVNVASFVRASEEERQSLMKRRISLGMILYSVTILLSLFILYYHFAFFKQKFQLFLIQHSYQRTLEVQFRNAFASLVYAYFKVSPKVKFNGKENFFRYDALLF